MKYLSHLTVLLLALSLAACSTTNFTTDSKSTTAYSSNPWDVVSIPSWYNSADYDTISIVTWN